MGKHASDRTFPITNIFTPLFDVDSKLHGTFHYLRETLDANGVTDQAPRCGICLYLEAPLYTVTTTWSTRGHSMREWARQQGSEAVAYIGS
jgi:hypothetical protein